MVLRIGFLLLFMLMNTFACKKKEAPRVDNDEISFDKGFNITSKFDDAASELTVNIDLPAKVHAYAEGEKVGKPLRLEISPKNGWSASEEARIPPGQEKDLGIGKSMVLTGSIVIKQKLKRGQGQGQGRLHLQVCSEKLCDRPRVHELMFP